jgi:hypothetical protein
MNNRNYPVKIYLAHPADTTQFLDFAGVTKVSATHIAEYTATNDANEVSGTEIETADYTLIGTLNSTAKVFTQATNLYSYLFLRFKASAFQTAYTHDAIRRLTLFLHNFSCIVNGNYGFKVDVLDTISGAWIEACRVFYHYAPAAETEIVQRTIAIRPFYGFTSYQNIINASTGYINIRIRSLYQRTTGNIVMSLNYAALLINGYGMAWTNEDNFTYRSDYTLEGMTGTLEFSEI